MSTTKHFLKLLLELQARVMRLLWPKNTRLYYSVWVIISLLYFLGISSYGNAEIYLIRLIKIITSSLWLVLIGIEHANLNLKAEYYAASAWYCLLLLSACGSYICLLAGNLNELLICDNCFMIIFSSTVIRFRALIWLLLISYISSVVARYSLCDSILSDFSNLPLTIYAQSMAVAIASILSYSKSSDEIQSVNAEVLCEVSHEIRTPLQGLIGSSENLLYSWEDLPDYEKRDIVRMFYTSSRRLASYLSDILDHANSQAATEHLNFKPIAIKSIIDEALLDVEALVFNKSISLNITDQCCGLAWVIADSLKIKQVIINLLSNAIKYTPLGAKITIHIDYQGDDVLVETEDQGPGIPAKELTVIFLPFTRGSIANEYGGTGLGLSLAANIIKRHGGAIWAQNHTGGASFYFTLPRYEPPKELEQLPSSISNDCPAEIKFCDSAVKTALIIDDDKLSLLSFKMLLETLGFKVLIASSGDEAVNTTHNRLVSVIFIDFMIGETNGIDVLARIRVDKKYTQVPAIFITGFHDKAALISKIPNSRYIIKPYTKKDIIGVVNDCLA